MDTLTPAQLVVRYAELKAQEKAINTELELIKPELINHYKANTEVETESGTYKVSIRSKNAIKFADTVTPETINALLTEHPEVAVDYAVAMKNVGAGLASKLEIYMQPEDVVTITTTFPVITAPKPTA